MPVNRDTERLYYNQRIIIDNKVINREPRTWQVTKVNLVDNKGVIVTTLAQTMFDEHKDYIEKDENGNVVGMWASYFDSTIEPTKSEDEKSISSIYSTISYSGSKPEIKSGGSYKKFTVNFYDGEEEIPLKNGIWEYEINGEDATRLVSILTHNDSSDVKENQIKIKFNKDDTYIGKILTISYISNDEIESKVEIEIIGL